MLKRETYHSLGILDVSYAEVLNLLRREQTKLDLLDRAQRRAGVLEVEIRHFDREFAGPNDGD